MSLNTKDGTRRHISAPVEPDFMRLGSGVGRRSRLTYAVSMRQQSAEEQHQFKAAMELFLSEIVRLHLDHKERS